MNIVPMAERHLDALEQIERACFHAPWRADMLREELGKGIFLVAERDGAAVSSTRIRALLSQGETEAAKRLL